MSHAHFAIVALALLGGSSLVACGNAGDVGPFGPLSDPPAPDLDDDGLSDRAELDLLRQFRPYWDLDPAESVFPISVETWADLGGTVTSREGVERTFDDLASLHSAVLAAPDGTMATAADPFPGRPPCGAGARCLGPPVYADAVPVAFSLAGRSGLVWLHYWLFFHYDLKETSLGTSAIHIGDWEHVCVLVAREDRGRPDASPLGLHYHHHGELEVVEEPVAWHVDPLGARHARVFVESGTHGMYPRSGTSFIGSYRGGGPGDGLLAHPIALMTPHETNLGSPLPGILATFEGRWGTDGGDGNPSPIGPLASNQPCDHDWGPSPTLDDWLPACRDGAS